MVTPTGFEPVTCPLGGKRFHVIIFNNNILKWYLKYVYVLNITANAQLDTENVHANIPTVTNWPSSKIRDKQLNLLTINQLVVGSIPTAGAKFTNKIKKLHDLCGNLGV